MINANDNPLLFLIVFGAVAVWLIRMSMAAIDRRSRSLESFAGSRGLAFSSTDPFELATLPFEVVGVRGGVAVTNVVYGMCDTMPVIGFDLRHQVSVAQPSTLLFSCAVTTVDLSAPHLVIARRTVDEHQLGAVVGGAVGIATESAQFDRDFVVRCDDRRLALAVLDPALMGWLQDARGDWSFELVGSRLLCYSRLRRPAELDALLEALLGFRRRLPRLAGEYARPARPDPLFIRVSELELPRPHRPIRVSSAWTAAVAFLGVLALLVMAIVAMLLVGATSLP
jgi:hypothetical protein